MKIDHGRVSTRNQNPSAQRDAPRDLPQAVHRHSGIGHPCQSGMTVKSPRHRESDLKVARGHLAKQAHRSCSGYIYGQPNGVRAGQIPFSGDTPT